MFECGRDFYEPEALVDYRLQAIHRYSPNHIFLVGSAADRDSAYANLSCKQSWHDDFAAKSRENADQGNVSTQLAGCHGLGERGGTADFDHVIDSAAVGNLLCCLAPVRHRFIIDEVVGPEALELRQLFLRRRRSDHSGASSFRELQRK